MKKLFSIFTVTVIFTIFFASCEKQVLETESLETMELQLNNDTLKKLQETSRLIADIVHDYKFDVCNEIQKAVNVNITNGQDEVIRFKDIFSPTESKFKELKKIDFSFSKKINTKSNENLISFLKENNVQIYWPYSELWNGEELPTLTYDPIFNDSVNIGYKWENDTLKKVLVNDDYAYKHPVWIININETDYSNISIINKNEPNSKSDIYQLAVGYVKATKQYDGLFEGGSEFKFCLLGGNITMTSAESFSNIVTINLTRKNIRKKQWVRFYCELDDDWKKTNDDNEGARKFGIIEYDKRTTDYTLSLKPEVVVDGSPVSVENISITIKSNEGWIKTDTYSDRDNFYRLTSQDMGNGVKDGYRIYASGGLYWTLPLRKF